MKLFGNLFYFFSISPSYSKTMQTESFFRPKKIFEFFLNKKTYINIDSYLGFHEMSTTSPDVKIY